MSTRVCDICGGVEDIGSNVVRHAPLCPNHRDAIDDTPAVTFRPVLASVAGEEARMFTCDICKGYANDTADIEHSNDCPNNPLRKPAGNVTSFAMKRWDKYPDPAENDPRSALDVAKEWIDAQPEKSMHVIVFVGRTTKSGGSATKFFQAGDYPHHAQIGLCIEGMSMMRDSG